MKKLICAISHTPLDWYNNPNELHYVIPIVEYAGHRYPLSLLWNNNEIHLEIKYQQIKTSFNPKQQLGFFLYHNNQWQISDPSIMKTLPLFQTTSFDEHNNIIKPDNLVQHIMNDKPVYIQCVVTKNEVVHHVKAKLSFIFIARNLLRYYWLRTDNCVSYDKIKTLSQIKLNTLSSHILSCERLPLVAFANFQLNTWFDVDENQFTVKQWLSQFIVENQYVYHQMGRNNDYNPIATFCSVSHLPIYEHEMVWFQDSEHNELCLMSINDIDKSKWISTQSTFVKASAIDYFWEQCQQEVQQMTLTTSNELVKLLIGKLFGSPYNLEHHPFGDLSGIKAAHLHRRCINDLHYAITMIDLPLQSN